MSAVPSGRPVSIDWSGEKSINLALQGGGAHGAFTWGVLDQILEDGRLDVEAISGTSAGAMNAAVYCEGYLENGRAGAREALTDFWREVSREGRMSLVQRSLFDKLMGNWSLETSYGLWFFDVFTSMVSPYEFNPANLNPLRDFLAKRIDFEKVRACQDIKVFVSATNVYTGKVRVFEREELTPDHVMASACLPYVFQAVEIEGEPYWDGGYMGNPALFPLFYETGCDDLLIVQINPIERRETPRTAREIQNRMNEISFNGNLIHELRAVDFVTKLIDDGKLSRDEYKRVLVHRIDGADQMKAFNASSKLNAEWAFLTQLRDIGRAAAKRWLDAHWEDIGKRSTIDVKRTIESDPGAAPEAARGAGDGSARLDAGA